MSKRFVFMFGCILSITLFSGCRESVAADNKVVLIKDVPHVMQREDFCGEACAAMYLNKLGYKISQNDVFNVSGLDPMKARGCYAKELYKALKALGFKPGDSWYRVKAGSDEEIRKQWNLLLADLEKGVPSIVCMKTGTTKSATEHFRLFLGYDPDRNEVIYHEPAEEKAGYRRMKLKHFLECWPLKYSSQNWTLVRFRLEADKIKKPKPGPGYSDADFAQHMMELKKKVPDKGFTIVIQKPFVVIGDESAAVVKARAMQTVEWATKRLKKMYFKKDPNDIIDIWLFKNNKSYKKHALSIFGDRPDTPYGYSSPEHKALIMNIGTGGGTLVHEIVHPFVAANFPNCPSWLNEGLGSLYEQSRGKGDNIIGLTNWRLDGLQKAIKRGDVPSFKTLTSTSTYEFYQEDPGTNYSQARYLCYYLQEHGLLTQFYHKFYQNRKEDTTGYETLKDVLGVKDMGKFKKDWESYVMKLRFP